MLQKFLTMGSSTVFWCVVRHPSDRNHVSFNFVLGFLGQKSLYVVDQTGWLYLELVSLVEASCRTSNGVTDCECKVPAPRMRVMSMAQTGHWKIAILGLTGPGKQARITDERVGLYRGGNHRAMLGICRDGEIKISCVLDPQVQPVLYDMCAPREVLLC